MQPVFVLRLVPRIEPVQGLSVQGLESLDGLACGVVQADQFQLVLEDLPFTKGIGISFRLSLRYRLGLLTNQRG
jgi:hypothetical protein